MNMRGASLKSLAAQALFRVGACSRPVNSVNTGMNTAPDPVDPLDDANIDRVRPADADLDRDNLDAVLIDSPAYGPAWLIVDADALDRHPDIASSGAAVLLFSELERLRGMSDADRRAYIALKRAFPSARPIQ